MFQRNIELGTSGSVIRVASGYKVLNPPPTIFGKIIAALFGGFFFIAGIWIFSGAGGQTANWPIWLLVLSGSVAVLLGGSIAFFTVMGGDLAVTVDAMRREFIFAEEKNGQSAEKKRVRFDEVEYAYLASQQDTSVEARSSDIVYLHLKGKGKDPLVFSGSQHEAKKIGELLARALTAKP